MKILLTGCTKNAVNGKKQATTDYVSSFPIMAEMLTTLGHTVDWREVTVGEELRGRYDLAIVGVQALHSIAGKQYKHGAIYAATQLRHIIMLDDWQIRRTLYSFCRNDYFWRTPMLSPVELRNREAALPYKAEIDALLASWWDAIPPMIAPLWPWGDFSKMPFSEKFTRLYDINPSPFMPVLSTRATNPASAISDVIHGRNRGWVLATLMDQTDWERKQGFTWPIVRQHAVKKVRCWGRVSEKKVVELYEQNWGVLSPKYAHAGSGWWRTRYDFAYQAGAIVYGTAAEMAACDPVFATPLSDIERMSETNLFELATAQRNAFLGKQPTRAEVLVKLAGALARESA